MANTASAPMVQAKFASSSGNWYIGFDYTVGRNSFQITRLCGWRSNYESNGNVTLTIKANAGTANTTQSDTVTASFQKGAWSDQYWQFGGNYNCAHKAVTGIPDSVTTLTVTITISNSFNSYLANGTVFTYSIAMPAFTPTIGQPWATNVSRTSATMNVNVTNTGRSTVNKVGIYYYKGGAYNGAVENTSNISQTVTGLTPNTTYAMNGWVYTNAGLYGYSNSNITKYDETQLPSFTTTGNAPSISWGGMVAVGRKYAVGCWHVGYDTNASFGKISANQYGTTTNYGSNAEWGWDGTYNAIYYGGSSEANGTLQPNTTYYYKFQQTDNWNRASNILTGSFTTSGNAPVYNTHYADNITRTSATVEFYGTYDNNSWLSSYYIDWGTSTSYGNKLTNTNALSNLTPNTTYYYKLTATDNWGRTGTATGSFTTLGNPPTITDFRAINIGAKEATLDWSDSFDTNASYKDYYIEYGTTTNYGNRLSNYRFLTDLSPHTTYYAKLTLTDNWGRISTATTSFTTLAGDATGYVKGYVDGKGVVWQRGTVCVKVDGAWKKGRKVRGKAGGQWYGTS